MKSLLPLIAIGCGASRVEDTKATMPETRVVIKATSPAATQAPSNEAPAPSEPTTHVRFLTNVALKKAPRADAKPVGIVKKGTVSAQLSTATADGCKGERWVEVAPRGWACESALELTTDALTQAAPASFEVDDDKPLVPGVYGVVRGADVSTSVRVIGGTVVDGERHVITSAGTTVPASTVIYFSPSKFQGVVIDKSLPAWVRNHGDSRKPVVTFDERGKRNGELAPRTVVTIFEESDDGKRVRVGDATWIPRADVRVASLVEPPPGLGEHEKWFDVDRDEQVLVAYEGKRPVYATLVSTGKWKHATPTVIARVGSKLLTASMNNNRGDEQYAVADVPWTMYYDGSYALHTSYWHDGFGGPRSHGCINLAPRDARALYQWSSPDIPAGWIAVYGDEDNPGSLVRVHARAMPEPAYRGYAKTLRDRDMVATSE